MKKPDFAKFNKLLKLYAAEISADETGGSQEKWNFLAETWAVILPVRGIEKVVAFQEQRVITHRIISRYIDDLPKAKLRLQLGQRIFEVRHLLCPEEDGNYLEFWVYEER